MTNAPAPAAPKALHDLLDKLYGASETFQRLRMSSQIIIGVDTEGKPSEFKVNGTGKGK